MSKFSRTVQKSGIIERLQYQLEVMEQVEMRQMLALACYQATFGELDPQVLNTVHRNLDKKTFKNREEMFGVMLSEAQMALAAVEYERANADRTQDSAAPSALDLPLSLSSTADKPVE